MTLPVTPVTAAILVATWVAQSAGPLQAADMLTEIGKGEGQLDIVAWPGYIERGETVAEFDWVTAFEESSGCQVNVKTANTSDEMVALMNEGGFDLVTAHFASVPRTPDDRAVANIVEAVALGGTLLVVGHDHLPTSADVDHPARAFDPDAYTSVDDFVERLSPSDDWVIETHERRERSGETTSHHVADVVLRARRRTSSG